MVEDDMKEFQKQNNIQPDDQLGIDTGTFLLSSAKECR
jgi:hypothetical protein